MKSMRFVAVLAAAALAGSVIGVGAANASPATKTVSFKGNYSGTASLLIENSNVKILSVAGSGKSSVIGSGSIAGTGNGIGANGQCVPFKGKGSLKGSSGTIKFSVTSSKSQGCSSGQSGAVTVTVSGSAKVTSGSGKAKGAKGTLKFNGTLKLSDTSGSQSGDFTGKLTGKLTVNK